MLANHILGTQIICHYPKPDSTEWKYNILVVYVQSNAIVTQAGYGTTANDHTGSEKPQSISISNIK
jgi:hypothetical protein